MSKRKNKLLWVWVDRNGGVWVDSGRKRPAQDVAGADRSYRGGMWCSHWTTLDALCVEVFEKATGLELQPFQPIRVRFSVEVHTP